MRSGSNDKKGQDKGSLRFIWIMITLAISLGFVFSSYIHVPIINQVFISYIGLFIIVVGMAIRFIAIFTLGKYFTVDVTIRDGHKIKTDGFYKIVRHPSYSGSLLSFVGFGISLNNWLSLTTVLSLVLFSFLYRIKIEEKTLIDQFGNEYLNYKKSTYRLIPWIY
jgi:protein-S-isoprenylcysteine O-methyltransferase Ste14